MLQSDSVPAIARRRRINTCCIVNGVICVASPLACGTLELLNGNPKPTDCSSDPRPIPRKGIGLLWGRPDGLHRLSAVSESLQKRCLRTPAVTTVAPLTGRTLVARKCATVLLLLGKAQTIAQASLRQALTKACIGVRPSRGRWRLCLCRPRGVTFAVTGKVRGCGGFVSAPRPRKISSLLASPACSGFAVAGSGAHRDCLRDGKAADCITAPPEAQPVSKRVGGLRVRTAISCQDHCGRTLPHVQWTRLQ